MSAHPVAGLFLFFGVLTPYTIRVRSPRPRKIGFFGRWGAMESAFFRGSLAFRKGAFVAVEPGYETSNIAPSLSEVRCLVLLLFDLRPHLVGYVRGALRNIRILEPGPYSFGYRNQAEFCFLKSSQCAAE
jgi:hypothetical protein